MVKRRKYNNDSIISKLFLIFVSVMLPVGVVGIVLLFWFRTWINNEACNSAKATVKQIVHNFTLEITDMASQVDLLGGSGDFSDFSAKASTFSKSEYYIQLYKQSIVLKKFMTNIENIKSVDVFYPRTDIVLSGSKGLIKQQTDKYYEMLKITREDFSQFKVHEDVWFIGFMYPPSTWYNQEIPNYVVVAELSKENIINRLEQYSTQSTTVLYHHASDTILSSATESFKNECMTYLLPLQEMEVEEDHYLAWTEKEYYIVAEHSSELGISVVQFVDRKGMQRLPNLLLIGIVFYFVFIILLALNFMIRAERLFSIPVGIILGGFRSIEAGEFDISIPETKLKSTKEFLELAVGFNKMACQLRNFVEQVYENKICLQQAELKQLQMQMDPHFLYNTYFILYRLIQQEDLSLAMQLTAYMGNYFQYITRNSQDMVTLEQEWAHGENYLQIQSIRFGSEKVCQIGQIPEKYCSMQVPRLIVQPVLENAFKYGLDGSFKNGSISMTFEANSNSVEIIVKDTGVGMTAQDINELNHGIHNMDKNKEYTALHNIRKRLMLIYGENGDVLVSPNQPHGLCVKIIIPITFNI